MFLALLPVTAMPVHAAGNVVTIHIKEDGTCQEGESGTGYSGCKVKTGTYYDYTEITVASGYTLVISNPSGRYVVSSELSISYNASMVYLVNGDYAGGDTDSNSQIIVFSAGSITGGTFSGTVWNYYRTISGGTFSGNVDNYGTISSGTFSGTVNSYGTISNGTFSGTVNSGGDITGGIFSGSLTGPKNISNSAVMVITLNANGGTFDGNPAAINVNYNSVASEPTAPTRTGYVFTKWYTDSACTKEYDFSSEVQNPFKLYAGWRPVVTISPDAATIYAGETQQFTADVTGNDKTVTWSIEGTHAAGTAISSDGLLTVDPNETATSVTVRATSTLNALSTDTAVAKGFHRPKNISSTSIQGTYGEPMSVTLTADGAAPITWEIKTLPSYLSYDKNTGVVTGTPTEVIFQNPILIYASNSEGTEFWTAGVSILKADQVLDPTGFKDLTKTYGDADFTETVTVTKGEGTVSYSSDAPDVATVDSTGKVTITGAGVATITATASSTEHYNAATASYKLTVNQSDQSLDTTNFNDVTKTYGDADFTQTVTDPANRTVTYSSSDDKVATVDNTGKVTIISAGTATITAAAKNSNYSIATASYKLTIGIKTVNVLDGDKQTITKGSAPVDGIATRFNADETGVTKVSVNGTQLTKDVDYAQASGSTIINLKKSYLDTLEVGNYTLRVDYGNSMYGESTFTIKPAEDIYVAPDTGDRTSSSGWGIAFLASIGIAVMCIRRKHQMN